MNKSNPYPLPGSKTFFHTPTALAKEGFLYPLCLGDFSCGPAYHVSRQSYDSFLFLYVEKGCGYLEFGGNRRRIGEGDILLLDCYLPHIYGTDSSFHILWMHFDGISARHYYRMIESQNGNVLTLPRQTAENILSPFYILVEAFSKNEPLKEVLISKHITDLLTFLVTACQNSGQPRPHTASDTAISHMQKRFHSLISVEELAALSGLSPYYFIRQFKKDTGMTPHQYLTSVRINSAKFYLKTTRRTVKDIGFSCGFQSENSFCISFRKHTGLTPSEYRNSDLS